MTNGTSDRRTDAELPFIGRLRASAADTNGSFELIEYTGPAAPPPHIHRDREECFFILDGRFTFVVGDRSLEADSGSVVVVPRGTAHGFTPTPGARALLLIVPAGLEGFFRELGEGLAAGRTGEQIRAELAGRYDSEPAGSGT